MGRLDLPERVKLQKIHAKKLKIFMDYDEPEMLKSEMQQKIKTIKFLKI